MDYFKTVGELGLGSRLKRLSDAYLSEVKLLYAEKGHDFEPRWFPLFSLLFHKSAVTVTSAATELNLTHPHISQLTRELVKAKLVQFKKNPADARSRFLALTPKGLALAREVQPLWADIQRAVQKIILETDPGFMRSLEKMENLLKEKTFTQRVHELKRSRTAKGHRIVDYRPELKKDFERLNRSWIEKFFVIEPQDELLFAGPEAEILGKGGEIVFAEVDGKIVGTGALQVEGGKFELAKLAVSDEAKGQGIGILLCDEIIRRAKKKGAKSIILTTNTCLIPAVQLYEKLGFREVSRDQHPLYARVNLTMEKDLSSPRS